MKPRIIPGLAVALTVLGVAGSALADLAPPDDYVENCTVETQQAAGETCVTCEVTFEDFEACANTYEPQGYAKRCKTWGSSVYSEVFCKAGSVDGTGGNAGSAGSSPVSESGGTPGTGGSSTTPPSSPDDDGGCSISRQPTSGSALLLVLVGLACGLRRRR